jgi:hypothetical protein
MTMNQRFLIRLTAKHFDRKNNILDEIDPFCLGPVKMFIRQNVLARPAKPPAQPTLTLQSKGIKATNHASDLKIFISPILAEGRWRVTLARWQAPPATSSLLHLQLPAHFSINCASSFIFLLHG